MASLIEETDRRQQKYWKGFLIAFFLLMVLLVVRHLFGSVFREHDLNSRPIGVFVLVVSVALLIAMVITLVKLGQLKGKMRADPRLREALIDSELSKLHVDKSWKAGFIGAAVTPFTFVLLSLLHPIDDPLLVAFWTPIVGSGAFLVSLYLRNSK